MKKSRSLLFIAGVTAIFFTGCAQTTVDMPKPLPEKIQPEAIQKMKQLDDGDPELESLRGSATSLLDHEFSTIGDDMPTGGGISDSTSDSRFDNVLREYKRTRG